MKKLILIVLFFLLSCGTATQIYKVSDNTEYGKMTFQFDKYFTEIQIDSIIVSDTLAPLDEWIKTLMKEDNDILTQYMYIKSIDKKQSIYVVSKSSADSLYRATKKITQ